MCSCDSLSRSWRAFANASPSSVHSAAVRVNVPAAFRLRTRPRSGRVLKGCVCSLFCDAQTLVRIGVSLKNPLTIFGLYGHLTCGNDMLPRFAAYEEIGVQGVFSTCGVRYNPNRCESILLA